MFYRIVLQSHAHQGTALDDVMRQFSYVTGLPASVTESLFSTAPTVIKRQVAAADAERISMTLRAIGAMVTVEPVFHAPVEVGLDPVTVPGLSMPGATLELPPPVAPERAASVPAGRRDSHRTKTALAVLVAIGALVAAYQYDETLRIERESAARAMVVKKVSTPSEPPPEAPTFKTAHIVGPWRCTDQSTGGSTHWEYAEDGVLLYFGDGLVRSEKPFDRPGVPSAWALEGNRLTTLLDAAPPRTVTLDTLSLSQFDYRDSRGEAIRCRRP